ncbi:MAG: hypothetical protein ACC662_07755 [Planctomycetota bacterium]
MRTILITCLVLALLAPILLAGEKGAERIAEAEKLAKDGHYVEAAKVYGAELALAQKKKDLPRQGRIARSMQGAMVSRPGPGANGRDVHARTLETLMLALDPKQDHAFLSAGQLAHALLMDATRTGNLAHVEAAAKVCKLHAKNPKAGPFARAMDDYATGLLAMKAGKPADAIAPLGNALAVTVEQGWAWPSVHVATELAAACTAAGKEDQAAGALAKAGSALAASGDQAVAQVFRTLVKHRLEDAPEKVLAAYEAALKPFNRGASASAAGGRGGKGGQGGRGGVHLSKIGRAWKKLSKRKPFVTVERTADGFVIRETFDRGFEATQPVAHGVKHNDDGGVTLSFWDGGVRLVMVDMEGRRGQPGESSQPGSFVFFHPLARGATWGVLKDGTVTQTKGR